MLMESLVESLTILFFSLWTAATVLAAVDKTFNHDVIPARLRSAFHFVPIWNFFAPNPGRWDYHLLYRDRLGDGTLTEWREAEELTRTPDRRKWGWNPELVRMKAVVDFVQKINEIIRNDVGLDGKTRGDFTDSTEGEEPGGTLDDLETVETKRHLVSGPYLLLLNYVTRLEHPDDAEETQFMLMCSSYRDPEPQPAFISDTHTLRNP